MSEDGLQSIVALVALSLIAAGSWQAFGVSYCMLIIGGLLLGGVVYARTRVGIDADESD